MTLASTTPGFTETDRYIYVYDEELYFLMAQFPWSPWLKAPQTGKKRVWFSVCVCVCESERGTETETEADRQ